ADIRRRVLVENVSKRRILRETGMHWRTLEKVLANPEPPAYRAPTPRARPKLGPYLDRISRILDEDDGCPRKQRHTAKRIFDRIAAEGYQGGYTAVKKVVRDLKRIRRLLFANPHNPAGEERRNVTVKLSEDEGATWPVSRVVEPGTSGYCDLAVGP